MGIIGGITDENGRELARPACVDNEHARSRSRTVLGWSGRDVDDAFGIGVRLADLAFGLARVDRATRAPDGATPESDTDHTVGLGLLAVELAARWNARQISVPERPDIAPPLNVGLVALFALVHELPEVHAGDVDTLGATPEILAAKREREDAAVALLRETLSGSAVLPIFDRYERQDSVEALFVRLVDKITPKLSHVLNEAAAVRGRMPFTTFCNAHDVQIDDWAKRIRGKYAHPALDYALAVLVVACEESERKLARRATGPQELG